MEKSKKFRMPAGIRNKLMAAIAMLLVSSIMMVSSTYAWFTLSTAPEVTGITTSVGANGNLEIALLTTETFSDLTKITSGTSDSMAAADQTVQEANITWGNLVDLSAASYGLNLIALNPAALNYVTGGTTQVNTTNMLLTAVYGADGRVAELKANTIAGVYNSTNAKWVPKQTINENEYDTYGVRAIGVDSNLTTAQIVLTAAKTAVNSGKNGASSGVSGAVGANQLTFLTLAMSLSGGGEVESYSPEEMAALLAVAKGVESSLNTIVKTYANAILANLAATLDMAVEGNEAKLTALRTLLSAETSAADLSAALTEQGVTNTYTTRLGELADAQADVAAVITACGTYAAGTAAADIKDEIVEPLIGTSLVVLDKDGETFVGDLSLNTAPNVGAIYLTSGLVAEVAKDAGTYAMVKMTEMVTLTVYAGAKETPNVLAGVATQVNSLSIDDTENAEQTISDFYGYVIDFAFRTNAAESFLQLQTSAVNRVYSDAEGDNLATQGAGSTATFAFDSNVLTETQVTNLLGAINLVFLNTSDGTIYGTAGLVEIDVGDNEATAKVKMTGQNGDVGTITQLDQNVIKTVSVLVYMDGEKIGNDDVANAASSGMLNLNLQFSSSAELIPMHNTALESMTVYTVSFNTNGGVGFINPVKTSNSTYTVPTVDESKDKITAPKGFTFKGWATTAGATDVIETITLEGDTTLYAVWEANGYTVTYNNNGGTGSIINGAATYGTPFALPTTADGMTGPTGKVFAGWSYTAGGAKIDTATIDVTEDITLYAVWEATTYTVSFNANYPVDATFAEEGTAVKTMADVTDASETYTLPTCTLTAPDGKVFGGWGATADANEYITTVTGAGTVYAIWVDAPAG